ncbi:MAG: hypothetical protein ABH983_00455 [Candidatus Micrarchaeota archaeon]
MMKLMGLVLTGADVKKATSSIPKSVNVDLAVTKITKKDATTITLDFAYIIDYLPKIARVRLTGHAYCQDSAPNIRKALLTYKKTKKLPFEVAGEVLNMINANAGMNAIFLIRPFNLLPPFMPPLITSESLEPKRVQMKSKKKK